MILAIDPGVRNLGWAIGGSRLRAAGNSRVAKDLDLYAASREHVSALPGYTSIIALESMVHRQRDPRSQPQDLMDVQTVGCLVAGMLLHDSVLLLTPSEWKGSVPKAVHHSRLLAVLDAGERSIVDAACSLAGANAKEVLDAVGIWLFASNRINRSGGPRR